MGFFSSVDDMHNQKRPLYNFAFPPTAHSQKRVYKLVILLSVNSISFISNLISD